MLSDRDITTLRRTGHIGIGPSISDDAVQPASVDVRLDRHFQVLTKGNQPINPASDPSELFQPVTVDDDSALMLEPGECALASTFEQVRVPDSLVAKVEGKSSLGRLFLLVHSTAGLLDPGFAGHVTLELVNLAPRPFLLWPGMKIAQVTFEHLSSPAERPYGSAGLGSHYQSQPRGPVLSRAWQRFTHGLPADQPTREAS